jgi:hypothetical protein
MDDEVGAGDDQGSGWLEVRKVSCFQFYIFSPFWVIPHLIRQLQFFLRLALETILCSLKYIFFWTTLPLLVYLFTAYLTCLRKFSLIVKRDKTSCISLKEERRAKLSH